jgi:hypothetical protein
MMMGLDVVTFMIGWTAGLIAGLIRLGMVAEVNRVSDEHSQLSYFRSSSIEVWQDYTQRYPKGIYRPAFAIAALISLVFFAISVYLRFRVVHR